MAPEQIVSAKEVDGRADIYALGAMVYQMLTGELPFRAENPGALVFAHLQKPAPDACSLVPELPAEIGDAIRKAMAKKPEDRFSTAMDFARAFTGEQLALAGE
jgi:serine/threonine-protein kinase